MAEIKSKRLLSRNLPVDRVIELKINSKPYLGLSLFVLLGVAICFTGYWIFGVIIFTLCLLGLLFIKNQVTTEFNQEYVIFYSEGNSEECFIIYWEDIERWQVLSEKTGLDFIRIQLKNGEKLAYKIFAKNKAVKYFEKLAPNPEESVYDED